MISIVNYFSFTIQKEEKLFAMNLFYINNSIPFFFFFLHILLFNFLNATVLSIPLKMKVQLSLHKRRSITRPHKRLFALHFVSR